MKFNKLLLVLFIVPLLSFSAHTYYLSLTQVTYKSESKSIQIIINVFMDDIETALNKDYNIDLQLTSKEELKNNNIYFESYLKEKLHFKVNGVTENFKYIGKEYDGDLVYFYLEIGEIENVNTLEVSNRILVAHFPKQQNLLKTKVGKNNKSILLTAKNDKALLKF